MAITTRISFGRGALGFYSACSSSSAEPQAVIGWPPVLIWSRMGCSGSPGTVDVSGFESYDDEVLAPPRSRQAGRHGFAAAPGRHFIVDACSPLIQLPRFVAEAGRNAEEPPRNAAWHPTNRTVDDRA
jgi:hypothetical protein